MSSKGFKVSIYMQFSTDTLLEIFILIYHTFQVAPKPINLLSAVICDMSKFYVFGKVVTKGLTSAIAFQKPTTSTAPSFSNNLLTAFMLIIPVYFTRISFQMHLCLINTKVHKGKQVLNRCCNCSRSLHTYLGSIWSESLLSFRMLFTRTSHPLQLFVDVIVLPFTAYRLLLYFSFSFLLF